jgi:hypothetical protein
MVTGRKRAPTANALPTARQAWGATILAASFVWMGLLFASYDVTAETVTLPVIGTTLHLELGDPSAAGEPGD